MKQENTLIIASKSGLRAFGKNLQKFLIKNKISYPKVKFIKSFKAITKEVIKAIKIAKENKIKTIIGLGGGKAIDVARAASFNTKCRFIAIPSNCSTCTAATGWCTIDNRTKDLEKRADKILLNYKVLVSAPPEYLVNGLCEATSILRSYENTFKGTKRRNFYHALQLERLLSGIGLKAIEDNKKKKPSKEFKFAARAVIISAARVFEKIGLGPGHSLFMALRINSSFKSKVKRQWTGYCALFEMVALNKNKKELKKYLDYFKSLGINLDIGLGKLSNKEKNTLASKTEKIITNKKLIVVKKKIVRAINGTNNLINSQPIKAKIFKQI